MDLAVEGNFEDMDTVNVLATLKPHTQLLETFGCGRTPSYINCFVFYRSSCVSNGKGAHNTPETRPLCSPCVKLPGLLI
eukprot:743412-Pyramimonas_sp.AAC.1